MTLQSKEKPYGTVLLKANDILQYLLNTPNPQTLAEISEGMGVAKPTTLKILNTLELLGWVRRDELTKQYYLGTQLITYADKALQSIDITKIAHPFLEKLRDETQETINLGILRDQRVFLVEKLESPQSIKLQSTIGGSMNLYSSAMGKAILATFNSNELHQYISNHDLKALTPNTIVSATKLRKDINLIKQTGFAMDNEENETEVFCLGTTIRKGGRLYGAFSISTPKYRLPEKRKNQFVRLLLNTQAEIEEAL